MNNIVDTFNISKINIESEIEDEIDDENENNIDSINENTDIIIKKKKLK